MTVCAPVFQAFIFPSHLVRTENREARYLSENHTGRLSVAIPLLALQKIVSYGSGQSYPVSYCHCGLPFMPSDTNSLPLVMVDCPPCL